MVPVRAGRRGQLVGDVRRELGRGLARTGGPAVAASRRPPARPRWRSSVRTHRSATNSSERVRDPRRRSGLSGSGPVFLGTGRAPCSPPGGPRSPIPCGRPAVPRPVPADARVGDPTLPRRRSGRHGAPADPVGRTVRARAPTARRPSGLHSCARPVRAPRPCPVPAGPVGSPPRSPGRLLGATGRRSPLPPAPPLAGVVLPPDRDAPAPPGLSPGPFDRRPEPSPADPAGLPGRPAGPVDPTLPEALPSTRSARSARTARGAEHGRSGRPPGPPEPREPRRTRGFRRCHAAECTGPMVRHPAGSRSGHRHHRAGGHQAGQTSIPPWSSDRATSPGLRLDLGHLPARTVTPVRGAWARSDSVGVRSPWPVALAGVLACGCGVVGGSPRHAGQPPVQRPAACPSPNTGHRLRPPTVAESAAAGRRHRLLPDRHRWRLGRLRVRRRSAPRRNRHSGTVAEARTDELAGPGRLRPVPLRWRRGNQTTAATLDELASDVGAAPVLRWTARRRT